eukprot:TRINITY_DN75682_c0_g1_i1.p1 TRINITY_DN75682_c0_g1~~TRINITY_DN75682_c0_g1_i1.p1  ORF type:complete len:734 (+),score=188.23 TRINITY_DN75682_c0_g1_i1:89-2203(+)
MRKLPAASLAFLAAASLPAAVQGVRSVAKVNVESEAVAELVAASGVKLEEGVAAAAGVSLLDRYVLQDFQYRHTSSGKVEEDDVDWPYGFPAFFGNAAPAQGGKPDLRRQNAEKETSARPEKSFPGIKANRSDFLYEEDKLDHLGRGSFGDVWKAYDQELKKFVAVKILYTKDSRGQLVYANWNRAERDRDLHAELERNKHECDIVKDMFQQADKDPKGASRICGCYSEHVSDATPLRPVFLVQELCGSSLTKYFFKTSRSSSERLKEARSITAQMLEGLRFLAALDTPLVHHDIKPDNVNVLSDGAVKIIDWGAMAKGLRSNMGGGAAWTPAYAPPEALKSMVSFYVTVDGKAHSYDMYAAGLMYLDMLTHPMPLSNRQMYMPLQQPFLDSLVSTARGMSATTTLRDDLSVLEVMLAPEPSKRPLPGDLRNWMRKNMGVKTPEVEKPAAIKCFQTGTHAEYWSTHFQKWIAVVIGKEYVKDGKCVYDLLDEDKQYQVKAEASGERMRLKNQNINLHPELIKPGQGQAAVQYMQPSADGVASLQAQEIAKPPKPQYLLPNQLAQPGGDDEPAMPADDKELPSALAVLSTQQYISSETTYRMSSRLACANVPGYRTSCKHRQAVMNCEGYTPLELKLSFPDPNSGRILQGDVLYPRDVEKAYVDKSYRRKCTVSFEADVTYKNSAGTKTIHDKITVSAGFMSRTA